MLAVGGHCKDPLIHWETYLHHCFQAQKWKEHTLYRWCWWTDELQQQQIHLMSNISNLQHYTGMAHVSKLQKMCLLGWWQSCCPQMSVHLLESPWIHVGTMQESVHRKDWLQCRRPMWSFCKAWTAIQLHGAQASVLITASKAQPLTLNTVTNRWLDRYSL